jgi:hypothetical protein
MGVERTNVEGGSMNGACPRRFHALLELLVDDLVGHMTYFRRL